MTPATMMSAGSVRAARRLKATVTVNRLLWQLLMTNIWEEPTNIEACTFRRAFQCAQIASPRAACSDMPFWPGGERPKCLDEAIRCEQKPVVHDAAIGRYHNKPGGSAGAVCPDDRGRSAYRGRVGDSMPKGNA